LGDTGQFPYSAAGEIIDYFHREGQDPRAGEILAQAETYFRNDLGFESSPARFVELMRTAERKVPNFILVNAIRAAAGAAGETLEPREGNQEKSGAAWEFQLPNLQRAEYVTAQLLSLAMRVDPPTAEKLRIRLEEIQQAVAKLSPASPRGAPKSADRSGEPTLAAEEDEQLPVGPARRELERVRTLVGQAPLEALAVAQSIEAPAYRGLGLAVVGECMARRERQAAISILQQAEESVREADPRAALTIEELKELAGTKLEALTKIAETWVSLGFPDRARLLVGEGYKEVLGFIDSQAAASSMAVSGLDTPVMWLGGLARVEARFSLAQAVKRIELIADPRLRAYALLSVAIEILQGV